MEDEQRDAQYLLEIKTVQASTFKQVVDAMKEILMDVNLEFDIIGKYVARYLSLQQ